MTEVKKPVRDYYKVLLVSLSGKGKTYSSRNLNPETTGFINMENKPLPFKNNFKHQKRCTTWKEAFDALIEYGRNPEIDVIFFDSLSAYFDSLVLHCRKNYKGFEVWNNYNEEIGKLVDIIKRVPKEMFVTAHYEILGIEGNQEKRVKVKGKELEGMLEKDFTIVLYADSKFDDNGKPEYYLHLAQENTSAKCPPMIFGEDVYKIPNDAKMIYDKIIDFVS